MKIDRAIFRAWWGPFIASLAAVLALLFLGHIRKLAAAALGAGLTAEDVLRITGALLPPLLVFAVPLAHLVAVVYSVGRMVDDGETVAWAASGVSPLRIARVPIVCGAALTALGLPLTHFGQPWGWQQLDRALSAVAVRNVRARLEAGDGFQSLGPVTVLGEPGGPNTLRHPVIAIADEGIVVARSAHLGVGPSQLRLTIDDGAFHPLQDPTPPSSNRYHRARFREAAVEPSQATATEATAEPAAVQEPQEATASRKRTAQVYAFWEDPDFQYYFNQSYIAESDVEPPLTANEFEVMQEVMEYMSQEDRDKAMSRLRDRQGDDASAIIDFTLGSLHFQRDEFEDAARNYQVAVTKYPKFRRAWKNLGLLRMRLQQYPAAASSFVKVIELGGGDALTYGLLGFANGNLGDHIAAESAYRTAAMMEPDRLDWRMGLARSFFKQLRFAEAAALCDALIATNPDDAKLWMLQANAYVGLKQTDKAAENLELVDRLGESDFDSLALLGDIYINQGLFDLGTKAYLRAIAKEEKRDFKRVMTAADQMVRRNAYEAGRDLIQGAETAFGAELDDAAKMDVLRLRARVALATGAGDEEATLLEEIVKLDPLDGNSLILLGQYHAREGDPDKAIFRYEQAASIEGFAADAKVRHAQLLASQGKFVDALPLLRAAQSIDPREHVRKFLEDVERVANGR